MQRGGRRLSLGDLCAGVARGVGELLLDSKNLASGGLRVEKRQHYERRIVKVL